MWNCGIYKEIRYIKQTGAFTAWIVDGLYMGGGGGGGLTWGLYGTTTVLIVVSLSHCYHSNIC